MHTTTHKGAVRLKYVTTMLGWLMGLGIVAFGIVGFQSIMATAPTTPLTAAAASQVTPTTPPSSSSSATSSSTTKPLSPTQLITLGQTILTQKCEACHKLNGTGGTIGPDLNLVLAGKVNLVPGGKPTNIAWLTKWISNPQAVWPQAIMPNLGLSSQQVQAVVAYLMKVKG